LQGWKVVGVQHLLREQVLEVRLEAQHKRVICSQCGAARRRHHDLRGGERHWRAQDAWQVQTVLIARLRRVDCKQCGIRTEAVPWARPRSRYTRDFERQVVEMARGASLSAVGRHFRLGWKPVYAMVKRLVTEALGRKRRRLRRIGVDEISYGRGQQKYLTIVYDHDRGEVAWVGEGREQATLDAFFAELGPRKAKQLECITMDMAPGYIASAKANAPQAEIVFDRFHIEQHLNFAVNEVRKREFWRRGGAMREVVRGKKWLLLKRRRRVRGRNRTMLDQLLALNQRLAKAYLMKESFAHVWDYRSKEGARIFLRDWTADLRWSRLNPLHRFAKMIWSHIDGVLAFATMRLSNGPVEGNNSRIRGLSHRARGYRNKANLILAIFHCCGKLNYD
jgi:transposase